jgi:predicted dehydrogenase
MGEQAKIGFVGTGGIARHHLNQLSAEPDVEIVALCDVVEERAREVAGEFGGEAYGDYRRMLDEVELDALYVCVPPFAHESAEVLAAERGIHLFVEKPVVMHLEQGLEILEAVEKAGILSSVGYSVRYTPGLQAARRFVQDREIAMISANRWGGIPGGEDHWWRVYEKSGGQLLEMATHQVDSMRWLAGDIVEVYARYAQRVTRDLPNMTVPDVQVVAFELASGAVGYISTSCALTQGGGASELRVVLRDMILEVGSELRIRPEGADDPGPLPAEGQNIDAAFVQAIRTGDSSSILCDYREGLKSAAACIAANESAQSGKPVACWNG